jgi:hypothetical protein
MHRLLPLWLQLLSLLQTQLSFVQSVEGLCDCTNEPLRLAAIQVAP